MKDVTRKIIKDILYKNPYYICNSFEGVYERAMFFAEGTEREQQVKDEHNARIERVIELASYPERLNENDILIVIPILSFAMLIVDDYDENQNIMVYTPFGFDEYILENYTMKDIAIAVADILSICPIGDVEFWGKDELGYDSSFIRDTDIEVANDNSTFIDLYDYAEEMKEFEKCLEELLNHSK